MWPSQVEIKHYSVAHLKCCTTELLLRVGSYVDVLHRHIYTLLHKLVYNNRDMHANEYV